MAVLKTVARGTVKLLLGLLLLLIGLYLLLLAINWQDAKPNDASLHMQSLLQPPPIPAAQNGYQHFVAHHANNELRLSESLQQLYHQCNQQDCAEALTAKTDLAKLIAEHRQLMEFYQQLLQYPQWQEPPPTLQDIPLYQGLLHGQRLLLWQAWLEAQQGNNKQVKTALTADYQFWQTVLTNSNSLITKMVSTAALKHHFQFAPEIIKQLPKAQRPAAVPAAWASAISDKALSLELVMAGEWHFGADILADTWLDNPDESENQSVFETVFVRLARPLFLLQDTKNVHAQQLLKQDEQATYPWYSWLRNPSGRLLVASSVPFYSDYRQRLQQLEPLRLQALQQAD
ncbi:hypothetical protein [Arsukibacterium perlucidum]|uniref:hypothetical protein n=1 Tax=Arsukibacterium perlucidum TaxID=368811 RepID=UPI00037A3809|nr:hypothetical protein [Arsukibacterium perlucidum]